jgi:hypothetical protein
LETPLFAALTGLAYLASFWLNQRVPHNEPDERYHLALARLLATADPLPRELPQVAGLGWDQYFPDKEFLFHQLAGLGYRLAGERGAMLLAPVLGLAVFLALFFVARQRLPPALSFLAVALLGALSPYFGFRTALLRPHVLAILWFALLALALGRRSRAMAFAACFLFALSYHALYVPAALLGVHVAFHWRLPRRWALATSGVVGLTIGTLVNPYFPSTLVMAWRHSQIAWTDVAGAGLRFGAELVPPRADVFLSLFYVFFAVVAAALVVLLLAMRRWEALDATDRERVYDLSFALASASGLWTLTAVSPRAAEYAIPLTVLVLAEALPLAPRPRLSSAVALGCIFALQAPAFVSQARLTEQKSSPAARLTTAAIQAIPADRPTTVFNCNWDSTPYLFLERPKARFVDVLDPSLLVEAAPQLHRAREVFNAGAAADPAALLAAVFPAEYVLCSKPAAVEQMEMDPHFRRLHPERFPRGGPAGHVFVYAVAQTPVAAFPTAYEVKPLAPEQASPAGPGPSWTTPGQPVEGRLADLSASLSGAPGSRVCAAVRPGRGEMARHAGAQLVGVGGGTDLALRVDGRALYATSSPASRPRLIDRLVRLPEPLTADSRVELVVCSPSGGSFLAAALSFWTTSQLDELCRAKGAEAPPASPAELPFGDSPERTCLAPLAVPLR